MGALLTGRFLREPWSAREIARHDYSSVLEFVLAAEVLGERVAEIAVFYSPIEATYGYIGCVLGHLNGQVEFTGVRVILVVSLQVLVHDSGHGDGEVERQEPVVSAAEFETIIVLFEGGERNGGKGWRMELEEEKEKRKEICRNKTRRKEGRGRE